MANMSVSSLKEIEHASSLFQKSSVKITLSYKVKHHSAEMNCQAFSYWIDAETPGICDECLAAPNRCTCTAVECKDSESGVPVFVK